MAKGFDPAEFIDHARGQTLAFLTTAYARQYTAAKEPPMEVTPVVRAQLLQKARMAEAEMFKTKWSKTLDCDRMMTAAYHHLGEFERFDKGNARLDSLITDTISNNYLIRLRLRSTAANMRGRLEEAINYMSRAEIIHDSLDKRNQSEQLSELATLYHLQEEQLSRQQAEAEAERSHIINIALAAGLLAALAFLLWFFHQKHIVEKKNQVLAREISESIKYREMLGRGAGGETVGDGVSNPSNLSDKELFAFLRENIMRDQLYLDPQLDRQSLVDRFALSKERIGSAFAKGSPYKSLIDFLTDCRLPYAAKLLTDRPDLSIADVARESGFPTLNTFGRNFKQKYALTPSQFREQQVK